MPLTAAQVRVLAPFLARTMGMDAATAYEDLLATRVLVGGLAAGAGDVATTIGRNIYVSDAAHATKLLDWTGRGWLAHELAHTMQWRRGAPSARDESERDARFVRSYLGAYASHDGKLPSGGIWRAAAEAWGRLRRGDSLGNAAELIHDAHPFEAEASRVARAFLAAHP